MDSVLPVLSAIVAAAIVGYFSLRSTRESNESRVNELQLQIQATERQQDTDRKEQLRLERIASQRKEWQEARVEAAELMTAIIDIRYEAINCIFRPSDEGRLRLEEHMRTCRNKALMFVSRVNIPSSESSANDVLAKIQGLTNAILRAGNDPDLEKLKPRLAETKEASDKWLEAVEEAVLLLRPSPE